MARFVVYELEPSKRHWEEPWWAVVDTKERRIVQWFDEEPDAQQRARQMNQALDGVPRIGPPPIHPGAA